MLSKNQIKQWKEQGFVLIENMFDSNLLQKCVTFMDNRYNKNTVNKDFGSGGQLEFPSNSILDQLTINEKLITCVEQLLGTNNILLSQSDAWGKNGKDDFSEYSNNDQRMHMDYGNNTFLHPPDWYNPEAVSAIIYLSDTKETGGATAAVPRKGVNDIAYHPPFINMPGQNNYKFFNDKTQSENYFIENYPEVANFREKLYQREKKILANIGDILFYRLDLWHRGTPFKENKIRNVMNLVWKKKECYWINNWNPGWSKKMYYGSLEKIITTMSIKQRNILGFPSPGDKYWTKERIFLLKKRYPEINLNPYLSKM